MPDLEKLEADVRIAFARPNVKPVRLAIGRDVDGSRECCLVGATVADQPEASWTNNLTENAIALCQERYGMTYTQVREVMTAWDSYPHKLSWGTPQTNLGYRLAEEFIPQTSRRRNYAA